MLLLVRTLREIIRDGGSDDCRLSLYAAGGPVGKKSDWRKTSSPTCTNYRRAPLWPMHLIEGHRLILMADRWPRSERINTRRVLVRRGHCFRSTAPSQMRRHAVRDSRDGRPALRLAKWRHSRVLRNAAKRCDARGRWQESKAWRPRSGRSTGASGSSWRVSACWWKPKGALASRRRMSFVEPGAPVNLALAVKRAIIMHGLSRIREAACRRLCRSVSGVVPTRIATLWLSHDVLVSTE